jgi:hypothetical protein
MRLRQENLEFEASLDCIVRPCLKKKERKNDMAAFSHTKALLAKRCPSLVLSRTKLLSELCLKELESRYGLSSESRQEAWRLKSL